MPPATPAPPTVGRFEIRRELGRGAQSVVYLAWDPQLQREVAIKTLRFSGADTAMNASLLAEARAVSRLRHANIVPIFDAGEEEGYPYLVFEYVAGRSLAEAIAAEGRISRAQAADWMRQVLDGLAAAHAEGIVHRDLKPSNILMDGRGTPRVMDFGIAVRLGATAGEAVAAGAEGLSGTPAYMAPEYIAGRSVGPRMDIFAAGLILLEMLTGAKAVQGQTVGQLLYRIAHEDIALPKDAGIDDRLGDIILKACARDPAARFESAARMREALDAYLGAALAPAAEAQKEGGAGQGTLEFLLRRMRLKTDFPALSDSVSAINKLTSSDRENINRLSNTILKDYALTN
ncbi:MAG: serine/threonine protein kinase, partial [Rhodocyclaceae bacterium]|nr:serine/threonine protein kinase [Rhodocyclaceae bacterium]